MSDPIIFTVDCTDKFLELDVSLPPKDMIGGSEELPINKSFEQDLEKKMGQFFKEKFKAFSNCSELLYELSIPGTREEDVKPDLFQEMRFEVKSPLVTSGISKYAATSFYVAMPKSSLTKDIKQNYKVYDEITYNKVTYRNKAEVYVLLQEGQSMTVEPLDDVEYSPTIVPGERPIHVTVSLHYYCPDHDKRYVIYYNKLMGSKEAIKNVPLKEAQKMFGITPKKSTDKKTGMLDFNSSKDKRFAFASPTQKTQTASILGG